MRVFLSQTHAQHFTSRLSQGPPFSSCTVHRKEPPGNRLSAMQTLSVGAEPGGNPHIFATGPSKTAEANRLADYMFVSKPVTWSAARYPRELPYSGPRWYWTYHPASSRAGWWSPDVLWAAPQATRAPTATANSAYGYGQRHKPGQDLKTPTSGQNNVGRSGCGKPREQVYSCARLYSARACMYYVACATR